ncbi:uncharacterized protein LOC124440375 [Xenia sp. Carnegie-2017]|uniref:uncharacterized protein LOC124440375 n=1 Tax=Xenia sp. Carnegie-2017 TaxID=2897299 RepID=UPI001F04C5D4|nr:uncharacterized protein LOC124440375 [Xenia sp. Carnegie-2017]
MIATQMLDLDIFVALIPFGLVLICILWSGFPKGSEKLIATWALIDGCVIHIWIEGVVCLTRRGPQSMVKKFDDFDTRYRDYEPNAMAMVWLELLFQGPGCVIWYHSIVKNRWYRPFVGIIVCSSFVYGTSVFVIAEVMDGCKHIVMENWPPSFTSSKDVVNFWIIFVFASTFYIVWPSIIIIKYVMEFRPTKDFENIVKKRRVEKIE